jgi:polysaccharide chain length determinant protein (PEP-CTERM system associated)
MHETIEQIKRYLRQTWHRRWIGLTVAWIVALVAITVVYRIPERFEASARVFVDTDSLLRPLLSGLAVQPNLDQQVALMSRTLITRPNVEKVVRAADLDVRAVTDEQRQALIDEVMKSIKLGGSIRDNLYFISYRDTDPERARKVVQSLLTIFVEASLGDKQQDTRTAVRFLDEQIKHYEGTLNAAENRLKEFKLRYLGMGQRDGGGDYFAHVGSLSQQIAQARLDLSAAMQSRDAYRRELSGETPTFITETTAPQQQAELGGVPEIDGRLVQLKGELDTLSRRYTESHPDVVATKRLIVELDEQRKAELRARREAARAHAPEKGARSSEQNPVFQQLRISLAEAEAQVAAAQAKLNGLEAQHAKLKAQAAMVPQIEAEHAQLNRDYDVQKRTYESLLARRESATMGVGVQDTGGPQFRVIEPPRVAPHPVAPNRLALLGGAFLASVAAGILGAFVAGQIAPTFHNARSLRESTNRPVLGLVSMLPNATIAKSRRRRSLLFAGGVSSLFAMFAAVTAFALMAWRATA